MPAFTTLVLKNKANENVSFSRSGGNDGFAYLVNSTGVPIGDRSISFRLTKTAAERRKVNIKLTVPVVQDMTVNGVSRPTIVRSAYANIEFIFSGESNTAEREDVLALVRTALANAATVEPVVTLLDPPV